MEDHSEIVRINRTLLLDAETVTLEEIAYYLQIGQRFSIEVSADNDSEPEICERRV